MIEDDTKRINKIRRSLSKTYDIKDARKSPMKTLLVRVMTSDLKERLEKRRKKPDWVPSVISVCLKESPIDKKHQSDKPLIITFTLLSERSSDR